ncbi:MAG: alpha/beta hydrolase-fold protein [Muribaculum sp.]|nr:alpha/beta hydrolase-fold protein [Muribaculum sp.]
MFKSNRCTEMVNAGRGLFLCSLIYALAAFGQSSPNAAPVESAAVDADLAQYKVNDVPHGSIRTVRYKSDMFGRWQEINVYTPPSYDTAPDCQYPVLYLCHGGGEDYTGWAKLGLTDIILDNLIATGQAVEMIVVMPHGHVPIVGNVRPGYNMEGMRPFINELTKVVMPFVEKNFRIKSDRSARALAGLSMGGGQSFYAGLSNTDLFSHIGVFGSGIFGGIAFPGSEPPVFDPEKEMPGLISERDRYNRDLNLFYISVGTEDPRSKATKEAVADMRSKGLDLEFAEFPGAHEWKVWRKSLNDFAPRLFKTGD